MLLAEITDEIKSLPRYEKLHLLASISRMLLEEDDPANYFASGATFPVDTPSDQEKAVAQLQKFLSQYSDIEHDLMAMANDPQIQLELRKIEEEFSAQYLSDEQFAKLLESVREGGAILRGEKEASRTFVVETSDVADDRIE